MLDPGLRRAGRAALWIAAACAFGAACATSDDGVGRGGAGGAAASSGKGGSGAKAGSSAGGSFGSGGSGASGGAPSTGGAPSDGAVDGLGDADVDQAGAGGTSEAGGDGDASSDSSEDSSSDVATDSALDGLLETGDAPGDSAAPSDGCPGLLLTPTGSPPSVQIAGDTTALANDYSASCGGDGPDAVYRLVTPVAGALTITLAPTGFDAVLHVRVAACGSNGQLCQNQAGLGGTESQMLSAGAGQNLYIFVDGNGAPTGSYTLSVAW